MTSRRRSQPQSAARFWILIGLAVVIAGMLGAKALASEGPPENQGAQEQLDRALAAGQPAVAFFHSLNCDPCIQAMEVVDEVLPEYAGAVALVDVNVSDTANHNLLRREGVRTIPAFYLYSRSGEVQIYYGVPGADELRSVLNELEGGG